MIFRIPLSIISFFLILNAIPTILCASFPPFSLVAPPFDSILPYNEPIAIGFQDNPPIFGLNRSILISVAYPRESENRVLYSEGPLYNGGGTGFCQSSTNFTVNMQTDQAGRYSVYWNITYSLSSDPSQALGHDCGPGPFTFESFFINNTYRVLDPLVNQGWTPGQPSSGPFTTISTASILTSVSEVPLSIPTASAFIGRVNGTSGTRACSWIVLLTFCMNLMLSWML
ncbi:hypothetical protein K435DRAFT_90913 [Dendrothele bispora CBS 962.96]|uniref:Uncharacterized protein n=1 Tax=Dendrothele bispora (strain CBS 962.96) TaxID=1314807 RepID=A0A4S8M386_DENBC|nr:hypothetical protein K435DRAFT_90913 [Dendrothele bispora CBS 962.96]